MTAVKIFFSLCDCLQNDLFTEPSSFKNYVVPTKRLPTRWHLSACVKIGGMNET